MFETFNTPALYVEQSAVLALYSTGRVSSVVIDTGESATTCSLVWQGKELAQFTTRATYGGGNISAMLISQLAEQGHNLTSMAGRNVARMLKEKLGCVANSFADIGKDDSTKAYRLPNGQEITLGSRERQLLGETLFQPSLVSACEAPPVHEQVFSVLSKVEQELAKELRQNIVLVGGNTLFAGFPERFKREFGKLLGGHYEEIGITARPTRQYEAWRGGAMLGSLTAFQQMMITKEEYDESGPVRPVGRNLF